MPVTVNPLFSFSFINNYYFRDVVFMSYKRYKELMQSDEGEKAGVHKMQGYMIIYPGVGVYGQVTLSPI